MDILDWLENQKGAEHRIAADEIKLLRTKAIPEGYVPLPIKLPYDQTRQVIVEYFAKSSNGECFLFDEFWEAMIEAALKPQKATL